MSISPMRTLETREGTCTGGQVTEQVGLELGTKGGGRQE